jgi:hypothetical protein
MTMTPIISTCQVSKLFEEYSSPLVRASEFMAQLERDGLIVGKRREMESGKYKVWRLSKKAKDDLGIKQYPVRFNTTKVDHFLALTDVMIGLAQLGKLRHFEVELREEVKDSRISERIVFAPDIFCIWNSKPYIIEVQRYKVTQKYWSGKWDNYYKFFRYGYSKSNIYRKVRLGEFPQIILQDHYNHQESTWNVGYAKVLKVKRINNLQEIYKV